MENTTTPPTVVPATVEEDNENDFIVEKDLSEAQEVDLLQFLAKVQKACGEDSSVPDFVGSQVSEWLKELQEKGTLAPLEEEEPKQQ